DGGEQRRAEAHPHYTRFFPPCSPHSNNQRLSRKPRAPQSSAIATRRLQMPLHTAIALRDAASGPEWNPKVHGAFGGQKKKRIMSSHPLFTSSYISCNDFFVIVLLAMGIIVYVVMYSALRSRRMFGVFGCFVVAACSAALSVVAIVGVPAPSSRGLSDVGAWINGITI